MHFSSIFATLFLASAVAAGPIPQVERDLGSTLGSVVGTLSGNKADDNGSGSGSGDGNGSGSGDGNGNSAGNGSGSNDGNGNNVGSGNDAEFLNDIGNISLGETSKQIAEDVLASIKTLSMSCTTAGTGGMRCIWS